jgi:hypothetical protein
MTRSLNGNNRKGVLGMKRSILRVAAMAHVILAFLTFVMWSPANGATQLSPQPAFNSRVVRLDHAPIPVARGHLVVAAETPAGGRQIDVYTADSDDARFRPISRISDPVFASGGVLRHALRTPAARGPAAGGDFALGSIDWTKHL